jgi:hypothetical protein
MPKGSFKYTVKKGETLCSIAEKAYKDASFWWLIRDANQRVVSAEGALVTAGTVLEIPILLDGVQISSTWVGRIRPWSAALRAAPHKKSSTPHHGILADLPRGTEVKVIGRQGGWLRVEVKLNHKKTAGFVSHELVDYVPVPPPETAPPLTPKPQTIGEFILFVEEVEHEYPKASPAEIATEIRQMWFSDSNWEILVAGRGLYDEQGKALDIETKPNPIAQKFDMQDLAPRSGGKQLSTSMGMVDIGHVMAGIDARLNGFPANYPKTFLTEKGHHDSKAELKYKTLKEASQGEISDFTTWAGDIGQAYAEYLASRYIDKSSTSTLTASFTAKASDAQLLGDIHGYIALTVHDSMPPTWRHVCNNKVSSVLRSMYLVSAPVKGRTYLSFMEQVSGRNGSDLRNFIRERSLRFARPWFAKKAFDQRGWWESKGWGAAGILESGMSEFDKWHAHNEATAKPEDRVDGLVDRFMVMLSGKLK